jgi:hypothetical protein
MNIQKAQITSNQSYLSDDFGLQLAIKKLGMTEEQLAEKLGRYSRGKRKGKIKGCLVWEKTTCGGWVSTGYGSGFVCRFSGITFNYHVIDSWSGDVLIAPFQDRMRDLDQLCLAKEKEIKERKTEEVAS